MPLREKDRKLARRRIRKKKSKKAKLRALLEDKGKKVKK
jgi:hypothetical protein